MIEELTTPLFSAILQAMYSSYMSLHISCSARYLKTAGWSFDKITTEHGPQKYWFRLKISARGRLHRRCIGHLTGLWYRTGRAVSGFDSLVMSFVNEPPITHNESTNTVPAHYRVDIPAGANELAGLMHVKLDPETELTPEQQEEWNRFPEVQINRSRTESSFKSKKVVVPYGEYFIGVSVSDQDGNRVKQVFLVTAFPDPKMCTIRTSRFYERARILLKSFLPA